MKMERNVNKRRDYIVGIDEVGRGPLAGPVTIGIVIVEKKEGQKILNKFWNSRKEKLKDSKKLSSVKREEWFSRIKADSLFHYTTSSVSPHLIDRYGISKTVKIAINRSLKRFDLNPNRTEILLDGLLYAPEHFKKQKTYKKGDERKPIIALASIMAKVSRDRKMERLGKEYPEYGFEEHKGYGTLRHRKNIKKHGLTALHRKSFCRNL